VGLGPVHDMTLGVRRMASVTVMLGWSVQHARDRAVLDLCFFSLMFLCSTKLGLHGVSVAFLAWFKHSGAVMVHG
jgi:hypothetical protein